MLSDIEIKVSASEFIEGLNLNEKKKFLELLKEDLGDECDKPIEGTPPGKIEADIWVDMDDALIGESSNYTERELAMSIAEIWRVRHLLTNEQIERIKAITKESYV